MQHKGIKYTILARPGRDEWTWILYLSNGETKEGQFSGSRSMAEERVKRAINDWLRIAKQASPDA